MNSGDWIENLTALEYNDGKWNLYLYKEDSSIQSQVEDSSESTITQEKEEIFQGLLKEFQGMGVLKIK